MFQFEADFVESLRCIPMEVRFKLDQCGIKLKLAEWHSFSQDQRQKLVDLPCDAESEIQFYRQFLSNLIRECTGNKATDLPIEASPDWSNRFKIPASVENQAASLGISLTTWQWSELSPLERFALVKLSRSNHENSNFLPALQEFKLI